MKGYPAVVAMSLDVEANKIGLGPRVAEFLRSRYSDNRAKAIARDFNVSVGTAKRWLKGVAPTSASIEEMTARWGGAFIAHAFADYIAKRDDDAVRLVELLSERDRTRAEAASRQRDRYAIEPRSNGEAEETSRDTIKYCLVSPEYPWKISLQTLLRKVSLSEPPRSWFLRLFGGR